MNMTPRKSAVLCQASTATPEKSVRAAETPGSGLGLICQSGGHPPNALGGESETQRINLFHLFCFRSHGLCEAQWSDC